MAEATGIKIMELVKRDIRPSDILTRPAFENTIRAPDGAVIKTAAASPELLKHTEPAAVLPRGHNPDAALAHITGDHVIVNRYQGPIGAPGMPESGAAGLPTHLLRQGLRDVVRITDARMSGTCFGTVVLHVAPEAAVGGALAVVENGDLIELDARAGKLNLLVDEREVQRRLVAWEPPPPAYDPGYRSLRLDQVTQAPDGCDFRFNVDQDWRNNRIALSPRKT